MLTVPPIVVVIGERVSRTLAFEDLLSHDSYDGRHADVDSVHAVIFTSGTTARSKGCVHTMNTLMFSARTQGHHYGLGLDDVVFMPSPVMHTTGLVVGVIMPLLTGCSSVLQARWEPDAALRLMSQHRCTFTLGATAFGTMMLDVYSPRDHDLSNFRLFGLSGAPIPSEVVHRLQSEFDCGVMSLYGSTEALCATATDLADSVDVVAESDGKPLPGVEIDIVDPQGAPVPHGEIGEIRVASPGLFLGYWDEPTRTQAALDDQRRLRTGDLARAVRGPYIRIAGRLADTIIRGGTNISALEVEECLQQHPMVREVAIVAMPDARLGEKACAYVVASDSGAPTLEELGEFLIEAGMAKYKLPERIELIDELPRNATGKTEKYKLREHIARKLEDDDQSPLP
jgi:cyclohexanecarboxylate-CoA ligase/acyl-CoA synthetase